MDRLKFMMGLLIRVFLVSGSSFDCIWNWVLWRTVICVRR